MKKTKPEKSRGLIVANAGCVELKPGVPQSKHTWLPTLGDLWPFAFHAENRKYSWPTVWWSPFQPEATETQDRKCFWNSAFVKYYSGLCSTLCRHLVLSSHGEKLQPWIHCRRLCYYFLSEVVVSFGDYVFCTATLWHSISQTVPADCVLSIYHKLLHDTQGTPIHLYWKKLFLLPHWSVTYPLYLW